MFRVVFWPLRSTPSSPSFAWTFLRSNWATVLHLLAIQGSVIYFAVDGAWAMCGVFVLLGFSRVWELVKRAAGFPLLPPRRPDEMTEREAFWLDPSAVLRRDRKRSPTVPIEHS